jgi:hypothetical protein
LSQYDVPQVPLDVERLFESVPTQETLPSEEEFKKKEAEKIVEFGPESQKDFEGLMHVGRLNSTFTWSGHKIKISTIDQITYLEAGLLAKPYIDSWGSFRAEVVSIVSGCLISVDDKFLPVPLYENDSYLQSKFDWVKKLHPFAIDAIYDEFLLLEARVREILDEMGKGSSQEESTPGLQESLDTQKQEELFPETK